MLSISTSITRKIYLEIFTLNFRNVQRSLLFDYGFLRRLMSELRSNSEAVQKDLTDADIDIIVEIGKVEQKAREREDEKQLLAGSRCPLLGHLVQIAQVSYVCRPCDTVPPPFVDVLCYTFYPLWPFYYICYISGVSVVSESFGDVHCHFPVLS